MLYSEQIKVIANFLLDGAKIIFGSLVVGAFVPSLSDNISWSTVALGLIFVVIFLSLATNLSKLYKLS
ncbi:MAG TPA: hypothetical protein VJC04_00085 [Candidatus Paceibacterota bacterium]